MVFRDFSKVPPPETEERKSQSKGSRSESEQSKEGNIDLETVGAQQPIERNVELVPDLKENFPDIPKNYKGREYYQYCFRDDGHPFKQPADAKGEDVDPSKFPNIPDPVKSHSSKIYEWCFDEKNKFFKKQVKDIGEIKRPKDLTTFKAVYYKDSEKNYFKGDLSAITFPELLPAVPTTHNPPLLKPIVPVFYQEENTVKEKNWFKASLDTLLKKYLDTNLSGYLKNYLDKNLSSYLKSYLNKNLSSYLKTYLDKNLSPYLKKYLDKNVDSYIKTYFNENKKKVYAVTISSPEEVGFLPPFFPLHAINLEKYLLNEQFKSKEIKSLPIIKNNESITLKRGYVYIINVDFYPHRTLKPEETKWFGPFTPISGDQWNIQAHIPVLIDNKSFILSETKASFDGYDKSRVKNFSSTNNSIPLTHFVAEKNTELKIQMLGSFMGYISPFNDFSEDKYRSN